MATSKKTTVAKAETAAHGHAELEAKVSELRKLVAELQKELKQHRETSDKVHADLANQCEACCEAKASPGVVADPRVDAMWKWLRKDRIFRADN